MVSNFEDFRVTLNTVLSGLTSEFSSSNALPFFCSSGFSEGVSVSSSSKTGVSIK